MEKASLQETAVAYDPIAKSLHWLMFFLLLGQFIIAFIMPEIKRGVVPETLIKLHLSFGILIMLVIILRLFWRLGNPVPQADDRIAKRQQLAARVMHWIFYFLLFVLPVMGWAAASARDWQVSLFDTVTLPSLLPPGAKIGHLIGDVHAVLSWTLLVLIGLHIALALYHYFILRDGVLQRMLPRGEG